MGSIELVVILLVGFIILGPKRMADAARLLGKATREIRRITEDLPDMILNEDPEEPGKGRGGYRGSGRMGSTLEATDSAASGPDAKAEAPEHNGPVTFRPDAGQGGSSRSLGPGSRRVPQPVEDEDSGEPPAQSGSVDGPLRQNGDSPGPRGGQERS